MMVFINLNMSLSTSLNIAFKALEFPRGSSSSSLDHSSFGFKTYVEVHSLVVTTGCVRPLTTAFHVLFSMDLRKAIIRALE